MLRSWEGPHQPDCCPSLWADVGPRRTHKISDSMLCITLSAAAGSVDCSGGIEGLLQIWAPPAGATASRHPQGAPSIQRGALHFVSCWRCQSEGCRVSALCSLVRRSVATMSLSAPELCRFSLQCRDGAAPTQHLRVSIAGFSSMLLFRASMIGNAHLATCCVPASPSV